MTDFRLRQAVHNNARWCDTMCRAHNGPGEFRDAIWINRQKVPPFYPNAITLTDADAGAQLASIRDLLSAGIPGAWAVKDSYCALDLAPLGFQVLFDAQWIWRSPSLPLPADTVANVRWSRIKTAAALTEWETAWRADSPSGERSIFVPALLEDPAVAVIAAYRDRRIVAGAIANRAAEAVGLSNVFLPQKDSEPFRAGCVAQAALAFPGLPLVGYESGPNLDGVLALEFASLDALRVWRKEDESPKT